MTIATGTKLGHYETLTPLGKGGMGEVWRARDTRLDREVAVKVLPAEFAKDADRLKRFEQEARATSALNHANILTIYDIGTASPELGGAPFIVAEFLEGEELRAQLDEGAIAPKKAIEYAQQIASGLAAAHAKGIVHRDLKPENLFVTKDKRVKILDFGLAKLRPQWNEPARSEVETQKKITDPGTVMGTVGYMSPEQVRGQDVDHRSDIFSFGVILYEMLSGHRTFTGESAVEVMNAILKEDPVDLSETNAKISLQFEKIVRRCLEKKPEQRFQSTNDLGFALGTLTMPSAARQETTPPPFVATEQVGKAPWFSNVRLAWLMAALSFFGLLTMLALRRWQIMPMSNLRVVKASLLPPKDSSFDHVAASPDGRWLAFTAATGGKVQLWLRALDSTEAKPLPDTEGARLPFWSPDNRFIGYVAGNKLRKIEISGETSVSLCDVGNSTGCAWGQNGVILFSTRGGSGISSVSADGGEVKTVIRPDARKQETDYHFPSFLPDGQHFLYFNSSVDKDIRGIYVASLNGAVKERLLADSSNAAFALSGQGNIGNLLFVREGILMAQAFDAAQRRLTGEPFTVAERIGETSVGTLGITQWNFSVSNNSLLVLDATPSRQSNKLVWFERNGTKSILSDTLNQAFTPKLSPDDQRIALTVGGANTDVWLMDANGANATRFTFEPFVEQVPLWSHDGSRVIWSANPNGRFDFYQKSANGAGQAELFYQSEHFKFLSDWSRDGRFILFREINPKTKFDIWYLDLSDTTNKPKSFPYLETPANEIGSVLSPDGQWMAYASDESGKFEIYVQIFPQLGGKRQISTAGGFAPRWRNDGKELFYHAPDGKLIAVPVQLGATLEKGTPTSLFEFRTSGNVANTYYDVTRDGQRFLVSTVVESQTATPLTLVMNWAGSKKE